MYFEMDVSAHMPGRTLRDALTTAAALATDSTQPLALAGSRHAIGRLGGRTLTTTLECEHRDSEDQVVLHTGAPLLDVPRSVLTVPIRMLWIPLHSRVEGRCAISFADEAHVTVAGTLSGYSTPGVCRTCTPRLVESQLQEVLMTYATAAAGRAGRVAASLRTPKAALASRRTRRRGGVGR